VIAGKETNVKTICAAAAALAIGASTAFAVSDGNYDSARQHCTPAANESDNPDYSELHCHSVTLTVRDGDATSYHEYFGIGVQQTPDHQPSLVDAGLLSIGRHQVVDVWYDPQGKGESCQLYSFDFNPDTPNPQPSGPVPCDFVAGGSTAEPDPSSGLHLYFGADDNTDAGEHDSSQQVHNGPSDGGAIVLNLDPVSVMSWMTAAQTNDRKYLLSHPLPLADAGLGFCADGICFSAQTTQRAAAYPDGTPVDRGVANYGGLQWDPESCSGPSDSSADCGEPPGGDPQSTTPLRDWNDYRGDPTIDPGIQIYEDPDAQGSPVGPYPLPAIYVGTCGVVIGGGDFAAPPSDYTNGSGQLVIDTGCHGPGLAP